MLNLLQAIMRVKLQHFDVSPGICARCGQIVHGERCLSCLTNKTLLQ